MSTGGVPETGGAAPPIPRNGLLSAAFLFPLEKIVVFPAFMTSRSQLVLVSGFFRWNFNALPCLLPIAVHVVRRRVFSVFKSTAP